MISPAATRAVTVGPAVRAWRRPVDPDGRAHVRLWSQAEVDALMAAAPPAPPSPPGWEARIIHDGNLGPVALGSAKPWEVKWWVEDGEPAVYLEFPVDDAAAVLAVLAEVERASQRGDAVTA